LNDTNEKPEAPEHFSPAGVHERLAAGTTGPPSVVWAEATVVKAAAAATRMVETRMVGVGGMNERLGRIGGRKMVVEVRTDA
jgi:hypothetical protein